MENPIHSIKLLNNHRLDIYYDENADSPDTWGNEDMFLVYDHRQFTVKREGFDSLDIYHYNIVTQQALNEGDIEYEEVNEKYDNYFVFTVYAHIHSGVSLSLAHDGDRFDTSSTGFILIKKDLLKDSSVNEEDLTEDEAKKYAEGLIETWNTYLSGQVYKFELIELISFYKVYNDKDRNTQTEEFDEEVVDSCSGFYDLESIIDDINKELFNEEMLKEVKTW